MSSSPIQMAPDASVTGLVRQDRGGATNNLMDTTSNSVAPLVSVVIPAYNAAEFLSAAIDSALAQSYSNVEIIVVDDGSTDHTAQIMERYIGRVNYLRKTNGGLASARNHGFRAAKGELVALLDADDICLPERLAAQVACFVQLPDVVICSSDFSAFRGNHLIQASNIANYYRIVAVTPGGLSGLYPSKQMLRTGGIAGFACDSRSPIGILTGHVYKHLVWGNFIHPPTVMLKRTALEAVGGFDEDIPNGTDYDCFIRVCRLGPAAYLDIPLLMYRYSDAQLSSPKNTTQLSLDTIAALNGVRISDPRLYRRHLLRFTRRIGTCYLNAANASLERDKVTALGQLINSVTHGVFNMSSLKVVGKLLLPRRLLNRYRLRYAHPAADQEGQFK